ncbi:MAG: glycosyltransferase family 2 protein [Candidatus Pacebacteria bacterium]|nr:glycosyltransferase family 2 protein [Candidatus Paceibacterota bacterium]
MAKTSTPNLDLSIIVVSYNTKDITLQTLATAIDDLKADKLLSKVEFFIVDNDSKDGSVEAVKKFMSKQAVKYTVIANKDNNGFAWANNQAIKQSQAKAVILLNSDTITLRGAFKKLLETFEQHPVNEATANSATSDQVDRLGIIAPMLLNKDKTLQAQGGNFPTLLSLAAQMLFLDDLPIIGKLLPSTQHTGRNERMQKSDKELTSVDWLGGTAMMIRKEVIDEIGLLDDGIFMYGEDIEYCMRARRHHWDIAIQPLAKIIHLGNVSAGSENAYTGEMKGYVYLWSKFKPAWQLPIVKIILWKGALLRMIIHKFFTHDERRAGIYQRILGKIWSF